MSLSKLFKKEKKKLLNLATKTKYIESQAKKMSRNMTWPEREFKKLMKELKIKCESQKIVGGKVYDFYLPDSNILVEVDGNYFHGKDLVYEEKSPMQKKISRNDGIKDIQAKAYGYKIERVWESDLKDNYNEVKKRFKNL